MDKYVIYTCICVGSGSVDFVCTPVLGLLILKDYETWFWDNTNNDILILYQIDVNDLHRWIPYNITLLIYIYFNKNLMKISASFLVLSFSIIMTHCLMRCIQQWIH